MGEIIQGDQLGGCRAWCVPVQRPLLPSAEVLRPYIDEIDATRWYSNRGQLVCKLERRLSQMFGCDNAGVVSFASGSLALEAAILGAAGMARPEQPLALIPSYTFAATAHAVLRCGYRPYFVDVEPETWMLDPASVAGHPLIDQVGVVVPVAVYGRRPAMREWEAVRAETGVPVVIDAAAAFERFAEEPGLVSTTVPAALSFHATKCLTTAEGGAVLLNDPDALLRFAVISNFGMDDARQCLTYGLNGKLSEYHAAIGLACLDEWPQRADRYRAIAQAYRNGTGGLPGRVVTRPEISSAYVLYEARDPVRAAAALEALSGVGVQTRRWYSQGLHQQHFFSELDADPLPVTEDIAARHVGLPAAIDLTPSNIALVTNTLGRAVSTRPAASVENALLTDRGVPRY